MQLPLFVLRRDSDEILRVHTGAGFIDDSFRRVSNEPFRRRFLELKAQGETTAAICRRLGWVSQPSPSREGNGKDRPHNSRLMRVLGLAPSYDYRAVGECRQQYVQAYVNHDTAVQLCEALVMDPVDAGL